MPDAEASIVQDIPSSVDCSDLLMFWKLLSPSICYIFWQRDSRQTLQWYILTAEDADRYPHWKKISTFSCWVCKRVFKLSIIHRIAACTQPSTADVSNKPQIKIKKKNNKLGGFWALTHFRMLWLSPQHPRYTLCPSVQKILMSIDFM